jgi:hypothetical protein
MANTPRFRLIQLGSRSAFAGGVIASVIAAWLGNNRSADYSADTCAPTAGNRSLYWQVWICVAIALLLVGAGFALLVLDSPSGLAVSIASTLVVLTVILCVIGLLIGSALVRGPCGSPLSSGLR